MSASEYIDTEFGVISIKRLSSSRHIRLRIHGDGTLRATMPRFAPVFMLKQLVDSSREELRKNLQDNRITPRTTIYQDGMKIGASHRIRLKQTDRSTAVVRGQLIIWNIPHGDDSTAPTHQAVVRSAVRRALDAEAKAYLTRRLAYLAELHGFTYRNVGYGNAKGRWGSCTNRGVITLNVALMNLPMSLVDYILIHELSHTVHLNHSSEFWAEVERCYPVYRSARKQLKTFSPYL